MATREVTAKARSGVAAGNERFTSAFRAGNAGEVATLYGTNAKLLPPNGDFVSGADAIRSFWQGAMDMGIKNAKLETIEVEELGQTAVEVGRYTLEGDGGQVLDRGKYLVVWKEEDGRWKLHRDIWNSSVATGARP